MRILHTADLHLGYKQYGFAERLDDFMLAAAYVFHQAKELKVDAIVLAGDNFQSIHPPANAVYFLYTMVQQAKAAGIRVLGIDGNHDATSDAWLRICGIEPLQLPNGELTKLTLGAQGDTLTIAGLDGAAPSVFRTRLAELTATVYANDAVERLDMLVIHQPLAEMCGFEGVDLTASEIAAAVTPLNTRLVMMGDIHDYSETVIGDIRFIYPGSTEINARDERPDKSFSLIDITVDEMKTAIYPIPVRPIFDTYIEEDGQLDTLLVQLNAAKAGDRLPLAIIAYNPEIKGFSARAQSILKGRVIYRLIPAPRSALDSDIFAQLSQKTFERQGALRNLRTVISSSFGEGSDEFMLLLQLLEQPDNVRDLIVKYAQSKGLDIK